MSTKRKKKQFPSDPIKLHIVDFKWPIRVHALGATTPREAVDQVDAAMRDIVDAIEKTKCTRDRDGFVKDREVWVDGKPFRVVTDGPDLLAAERTVHVFNTLDDSDFAFVRVKR